MKKVLSVFLAIMMLFCSCAIAVSATEVESGEPASSVDDAEPAAEPTTKASEERTTRNIKTDDGKYVVPINFTQLKQSFVFKLIEKIISFILGLFGGNTGENIDNTAADAISEILSVADERLSEIASTLEAGTEGN